MDILNKEQRSKNMRAIRSKGTKAERKLAKALWERGYRYRKNVNYIFGRPDFVFKKIKLAIFVDSEFFHGRDWEINKERIKTNREFWWKKIENNMIRDKCVVEKLTHDGWKILRFWDKEIHNNLIFCLNEIERVVNELKDKK